MAEELFSQAFARARREGKKTFVWKGKTYGMKLKGEDDSSNKGRRQNKPSQDNYQSVLPLLPEVTVTPRGNYLSTGMPDGTYIAQEDSTRVAALPVQGYVAMTPERREQWEQERRSGGGLGQRVRRWANSNPVAALADKKLRGKTGQGTQYNDEDIPYRHYQVLSDQSKYVWDNIVNVLGSDVQKLSQALNNTDDLERRKEMQGTLDTKKKFYDMARRGTLETYLKMHPEEKVVVGANFRRYKDDNQERFPEGTPTGYAGFGRPRYLEYAMETPLGQVETIWGNSVMSFRYDPKSGQIIPAASDTYDFNSYSDERHENSAVGAMRKAVGKDKDMNEGSRGRITRRTELKPIGDNYQRLDREGFGIMGNNPNVGYEFINQVIAKAAENAAKR